MGCPNRSRGCRADARRCRQVHRGARVRGSRACAALARAVEPGRIVRLDVISMALGLALAAGAFSPLWPRALRSQVHPLNAWSRSWPGDRALRGPRLGLAGRRTDPPRSDGSLGRSCGRRIAAFGYGLSCPMDLGPLCGALVSARHCRRWCARHVGRPTHFGLVGGSAAHGAIPPIVHGRPSLRARCRPDA